MITATEPLCISERNSLIKTVKRLDRQSQKEIRRYSLEELIDGLKAQVRRDHPDFTEDQVRRRALERYSRLKKPYSGPQPTTQPSHHNAAHSAARKAQRAKMKGNR